MYTHYRQSSFYENDKPPEGLGWLCLIMILLMIFTITIYIFSPNASPDYRGYEIIDKGRWGRYGTPTLVLKGQDKNGNDKIVTLGVNADTYYGYDIGDEFE